MKIAGLIARLLLGLMFTVFGLNGFLHFIPMGPTPTGLAGQYFTVMTQSGMMPMIFALQLIGGVLLLAGLFVPIALVILAPIIVNILMFHLTLAPSGIGAGLVALVLWLIVAHSRRAAFVPLFAR